jgi:hypothetical protein
VVVTLVVVLEAVVIDMELVAAVPEADVEIEEVEEGEAVLELDGEVWLEEDGEAWLEEDEDAAWLEDDATVELADEDAKELEAE